METFPKGLKGEKTRTSMEIVHFRTSSLRSQKLLWTLKSCWSIESRLNWLKYLSTTGWKECMFQIVYLNLRTPLKLVQIEKSKPTCYAPLVKHLKKSFRTAILAHFGNNFWIFKKKPVNTLYDFVGEAVLPNINFA